MRWLRVQEEKKKKKDMEEREMGLVGLNTARRAPPTTPQPRAISLSLQKKKKGRK